MNVNGIDEYGAFMRKKIDILKLSVVLFLFFLSVNCVGCPPFSQSIKGNGIIETKNFFETDFTAISFAYAWNATIQYGEQFSIQIEMDENIFPYLNLSVTDATLHITFTSGYSLSPTTCKAAITIPVLSKLETSGSLSALISSFDTPEKLLSIRVAGSANITATDITLKTLQLAISGSGEFNLAGKAQNMEVGISGSGDIKAVNLEAEKADISIEGSGSVKVWVKNHLSGNISGTGSIRYKGNPATIERTISGVGKISPL